MKLQERIDALDQLGKWILTNDDSLEKAKIQAKLKNPWFTIEHINDALQNMSNYFLQKELLIDWSERYDIDDDSYKKIALILAGNIPAVGFHDMMCVFVSNHTSQIKLSSKDNVLIPMLIKKLQEIDSRTSNYFEFVERIENFDAVIATGSNNTSLYFEQYFSKYPHIIRKNRHAVAVVYPDMDDQSIIELGKDIYQYFGLGCRNVSKLLVKTGTELERLMELWHHNFGYVLQHTKYMNNFDYNYAIFLMNEDEFLMNGGLILKKDPNIHSRIASVHYEWFEDDSTLLSNITAHQEDIQCVISPKDINGIKTYRPGTAQKPELWDYADGVDVMEFLNNIE